MGKQKDYAGMVRVYDRIAKCRELDQRESERLDEILRQEAWAIAQRKYREKNAEELDAKRRAWYSENKERAAERARHYRAAKPHKNREACRRWREKQAAKS